MADFTEKQLEDWLVDNWQQASKRALFPYLPPSYDIELIGRQVFCSVGIIDLLAFTGRTFLVIELKAVTADEKAVEQVI
jgi:Holliday junction resolvase-like predicted endonuclease